MTEKEILREALKIIIYISNNTSSDAEAMDESEHVARKALADTEKCLKYVEPTEEDVDQVMASLPYAMGSYGETNIIIRASWEAAYKKIGYK